MVRFNCAYCGKLVEKNCNKTAKRLRDGLPCYCNKSCANSARVPTEEHRRHVAESVRRFNNNFTGENAPRKSRAKYTPEERAIRAEEKKKITIENQIIHNMMKSNVPGAYEEYARRKEDGRIQKYTFRNREPIDNTFVFKVDFNNVHSDEFEGLFRIACRENNLDVGEQKELLNSKGLVVIGSKIFECYYVGRNSND